MHLRSLPDVGSPDMTVTYTAMVATRCPDSLLVYSSKSRLSDSCIFVKYKFPQNMWNARWSPVTVLPVSWRWRVYCSIVECSSEFDGSGGHVFDLYTTISQPGSKTNWPRVNNDTKSTVECKGLAPSNTNGDVIAKTRSPYCFVMLLQDLVI